MLLSTILLLNPAGNCFSNIPDSLDRTHSSKCQADNSSVSPCHQITDKEGDGPLCEFAGCMLQWHNSLFPILFYEAVICFVQISIQTHKMWLHWALNLRWCIVSPTKSSVHHSYILLYHWKRNVTNASCECIYCEVWAHVCVIDNAYMGLCRLYICIYAYMTVNHLLLHPDL